VKIAVIGGGAAGFFAALAAKENHPHAQVVILEKSQKYLSKVKVSGGGRCNVTNGETSISRLAAAYPRGSKPLKKAFRIFNTQHTMDWFESRGVALMTQEDNCVFPVSQDSQTIIDCFLREAKRMDIKVLLGHGVKTMNLVGDRVELTFLKPTTTGTTYDKVIIATGGSPKREGLQWLEDLGHKIEDPVPSLFTFNMPHEPVRDLMGIVVENAWVKIQGSKLTSEGPLLITHWGMSGPAILKLSAFGARLLNDVGYRFNIQVNWVNVQNYNAVVEALENLALAHAKKLLTNFRPYGLPERLWHFLLGKTDLPAGKTWGELGKKGIHKITTLLTNDVYQVEGKTTFKEEFVTCGGVSLESIDCNTMRSRVHPQLYFAGEVMDMDGITGGYNFQAAWTTAFIAGQLG
jgi:predicted Rossmann fold flavoprotein